MCKTGMILWRGEYSEMPVVLVDGKKVIMSAWMIWTKEKCNCEWNESFICREDTEEI